MDIGAALGQGMLILDVTQAAAKPGAVNTTAAGWFKRSEIPKSQVADFGWVANHILPLIRRPVDYSLETSGVLFEQ